jgi:peptidoglycan/xylan/chitin deacetylase (PgdA/CDA1 family)
VSGSRVALTFDAEHADRPAGRAVADEILAVLARNEVRATFFLQGRWASSHPDIAREIGQAGHLVGNHSHSHAPLTHLTDDGLRQDIADAEDAIRAAAGIDPRPWFRCPFGTGADDVRVRGALEAAGYRHIGWDVDVSDWEDGRTARAVETDVVSGVFGRGGETVVLLHTWPVVTGAALPGIIDRLRDRGATFIRVDEIGVWDLDAAGRGGMVTPPGTW